MSKPRKNKYDDRTFSHIFDHKARIVVTKKPERYSKENRNPDTLAYGHYSDEPATKVRPFLDEELVTIPNPMAEAQEKFQRGSRGRGRGRGRGRDNYDSDRD